MRWLVGLTVLGLIGGIAGPQRASAMPRTVRLSSIHMVSASTGWGLAGQSVLRTVDGGVRWTNVTPTRFAPGGDVSTDFLTAAEAWVASLEPLPTGSRPIWLTVFHTTNAGRSWQRSRLPLGTMVDTIGPIDFVGPRVGWAMVVRDRGAGQMHFDILRTVDSGLHWTMVSRAGRAASLPSCNCTRDITFQNAAVGWATGAYFAGPSGAFLYVTRDAGRTWTHRNLAVPGPYQQGAIQTDTPSFFSSGRGVLPVILYVERRPTELIAYHTRNGGASWIATTPLVVKDMLALSTFADGNHGWVTDRAKLYRTVDGGYRWSALAPSLSLAGATQLQFVNGSAGFMVGTFRGGASLLKTGDGGRTWTAVITSLTART